MNIALWAALLRVFCIVSVHATALVVLFHRSAHAQGLIRAEVDGSVGGVTQFGQYIDRNLPLARANLGISILAAGSVAPIFTLGIESLGWGRGSQAMTGQCLPTPDGRCHALVYVFAKPDGSICARRSADRSRAAHRASVRDRWRTIPLLRGSVRGSPVGSIASVVRFAPHIGLLGEGRVGRVTPLAGSSATIVSYTVGLRIE
jgi:hypothetical protein